MFAIVCLLFCVLHGAKSADIERVVEDLSEVNQPSLGLGRKLGAVAVDDFSALVASGKAANRGTCSLADILEPGFARKGEPIREATTPDATNCAGLCANTVRGCVAINYRASDKTCFFLADPGYAYVSQQYITALVNPSADDVCSSDNMLLDYNRSGSNMPGSPHTIKNAKECCMLCYTTPGCITFAQEVGGTACWLKYKVPRLSRNPEWSTGLVCLK